MLPLFADIAANEWQVAAYQGAIAGGILGAIQFYFNVKRDSREKRRSQVELSYKLMDAMFEDKVTWSFLKNLDSLQRARMNPAREIFDEQMSVFEAALSAGPNPGDPATEKLQFEFDYLLYYLNRFEVSLQTGMIIFSDIRSPINYYIRLLQPFKSAVIPYCRFTNYLNVIKFFERFDEWK